MVQDKVRSQMIRELQVEDEEERDKRLNERLRLEMAKREFKKQQRQAFMPMHKNMPDFIEQNHRKSTFVKERNPVSM